MTYRKGRLRLEDFTKIHDYNELDLAKLIREQAQAAEKQSDKVVRGTKSANVEVRKLMNDLINLSYVMRDMVKVRTGKFTENKMLLSIIAREQATIEAENRRTSGLSQEKAEEKIQQIRIAEKTRRDQREQEIKERAGPAQGEPKKAQDEL